MKQSNSRAPLVFRIGLLVVCALLLSSRLLGGLYARYAATVEATDGGRVAKFAYSISGLDSDRQLSGVAALGNSGAVLAVQETLTVSNNGEVTFGFTTNLTLADENGNPVTGYSLGAVASRVFMVDSSSFLDLPSFSAGRFYYRVGSGAWTASATPSLTGELSPGESLTYTVLYFIDMRLDPDSGLPTDTALGERMHLRHSTTCTQLD